MAQDYYQTLGISKTATPEEIKKAFRKLAHEHHPDKQGGNAEKFKEINEAYQILSNPEKRQKYDQFGSAAFEGQGWAGTGMSWEDILRQSGFSARGGSAFGGGLNFDFDVGDFGDILGSMFGFNVGRGSRRRQSGPVRGEDMEIELSLDFLEAVFGVEKTIRLEREVKCPRCHGNAAEPGTKIVTCDRCGGRGEILHTRTTILGTMQSHAVCPECQGEGKKAATPCRECRGAGRLVKREEVKLKIPAGIDNGQTVKMSGLGNAGLRGGASGDLYVHVRVKPHKKFRRDGNNIITDENITISQAVLGDDILVETVHGPVKLKIPAGTESGKVFKLSGKGVPRVHSSGNGDHLAIVHVRIPSKLGRKERDLFSELRKVEKGSSFAKASEDLRDKGWF